jgi:hypothetical protein
VGRVAKRAISLAAALLAALACVVCGGAPSGPSEMPGPRPGPGLPQPPPMPEPPQTVAAAGDIAMCDANSEATARLLDTISGTVLALGDLAYFTGSRENFRDCYHPTWGRHRDRTRPTPGNHEYETPAAAGYFEYFGPIAGPPGLGYYSFNRGAWHLISLNSNVSASAGSAQAEWLRADLIDHFGFRCVLAYWHHPLVSSGPNGDNPGMRDLWRILHQAGADLILTAHDHSYERFAPQDAELRADLVGGMRSFVVGTGGATPTPFFTAKPNSQFRLSGTFGVLKLMLHATGYDWEFVAAGGGVRDSGSDRCH